MLSILKELKNQNDQVDNIDLLDKLIDLERYETFTIEMLNLEFSEKLILEDLENEED